MHSHESEATPETLTDADLGARARRQSLGFALGIALASIVGGVVSVIALADARPGITARAATAMWAGGTLVAGFAAVLVERHRRMLWARIDQLRELTRGLQRSAIQKDEFLASVSHELRTPLNVVLGYIDLLLDHSSGPLEPTQRDILHRITKNASNLSRLLNDLVDLSRIEAGRMRIEMEVVDLEPLFAELTASMEVLLAGHDVTFRAAIATGAGRVRADPDRLKQIISNLLVNAVKFTERGSIVLHADSGTDGRAVVTVTDTGIGIPSADHHAIFEPFRQVHDRERRAPGAGIGLSVSLRLANLMGGSLGVESTPGWGSRFTLVLQGARASEGPTVVGLRKVS